MKARAARPDLLLLLLLQLFAGSGAAGGEEGLTGRQIMERAGDASSLGLENGKASVKMVLENKKGQRRERTFTVKSKVKGGLRKMILKFTGPADVMGTGLLLLERSKGNDDQYLYLPETGKIRKIAGRQSHAAFLSSDFLYWDLKHHDVDGADHERLADKKISGIDCRVVKTLPHEEEDAPYGKIVTWVAESNDVPVKMEFYNKKWKKIKKLVNSKIEKKEARWVIMRSRMTDLESGHTTELIVESVESMEDIPDEEFTKVALKRI